jgi:hypothetical protein
LHGLAPLVIIRHHAKSAVGARKVRQGESVEDAWLSSTELADELAKIVAMIDLLERRSDEPARSLLGSLRKSVTSKRVEILSAVHSWEEDHTTS